MRTRTATVLMAVVLAVAGPARSDPARPNVVIILADDLGYSDPGCYGGEIRTPRLDGLAAGGIRFTQFTNTARCWPTRAAVLTGYYAQQVRRDVVPGVKSGAGGTRPAWAKLLPERLRPLGYRSYHSGKWHVDGMPMANGFDHSYYIEDLGRYFHPRILFEDDRKRPPVEPGSGYYTTAAIADHAIGYLADHAANHRDRPFFLYVAFNAPHFPLQAPAGDIDRYRGRYDEGWEAVRARRWKRIQDMGLVRGRLSDVERDVGPPYDFPKDLARLGPGEVNRPVPWSAMTAEQRAFQAAKMEIHAAMVDRMDREIGRVLDQLRAMGAWDNTLILFLSDNGASAEIMVRDDGHDPSAPPGSAASHLCLGPGWSTVANTPFRRHKTWVHEGGISTPLIAHWPRGIAARGELRHNPGHVIDLVPTILEAAGVPRPDPGSAEAAGRSIPPFPGKSLLPAFARDGSVTRDAIWWEHEGNRAIRVGDRKLVAAKGQPWELYDLATDRTETRDLAAQQPEKVRELAGRWQRMHDEFAACARVECALANRQGSGPPSSLRFASLLYRQERSSRIRPRRRVSGLDASGQSSRRRRRRTTQPGVAEGAVPGTNRVRTDDTPSPPHDPESWSPESRGPKLPAGTSGSERVSGTHLRAQAERPIGRRPHFRGFPARAFQAASTFASRSCGRPARSFERRSSGRAWNQSSVAFAVSAIGRNVSPALIARALLTFANRPSRRRGPRPACRSRRGRPASPGTRRWPR